MTTGADATLIDSTSVANAPAVSVARAVKSARPAVVGVPVMLPLGASVNPAGRLPDSSVHVNPPTPPVAANAALYATPTVPPGSAADPLGPAGNPLASIVTGGGATLIDNSNVANAPALSVARAVKSARPAAVGVPVMPPPGASVNPAGNDPDSSVHVNPPAPPLAASAAE